MKGIEFDASGGIAKLGELAAPLSKADIEVAADAFNQAGGVIDSYVDSTTYDVIINGVKYPPKAIFGLAMSTLLEQRVRSNHFKGGVKSACFTTLEKLGFEIVRKTKKENEEFAYSNFKIGNNYKKLESMELAGVTVPKQARDIPGVTRFKNCVVLFVTLDKEQKEEAHKYHDTFLVDGRQFHWESQNANTPSTPHMEMIFSGAPVVLFARVHQKIKGKTQPFIYVGQLRFVEYNYPVDNLLTPIQVLFDVLEHKAPANASLSTLYAWEPEDQTETIERTTPKLLKKVRSTGQGRMVDAKKRKAIEMHAMGKATAYYEGAGYEVVDTSANSPYDLECYKGEEFRRVEVKGTISAGESVYVTSGEVIDANCDECETDLFIVSFIGVTVLSKGEYETYGGTAKLISNWKPEKENLEPKTYKYLVP